MSEIMISSTLFHKSNNTDLNYKILKIIYLKIINSTTNIIWHMINTVCTYRTLYFYFFFISFVIVIYNWCSPLHFLYGYFSLAESLLMFNIKYIEELFICNIYLALTSKIIWNILLRNVFNQTPRILIIITSIK